MMKNHEKLMMMAPSKALLIIGIPSVLMQLIDEFNSLIDAIFMGQFLGGEAVASMSIVFPYLLLLLALGAIFSSGAMVSIGRLLGAKNTSAANDIFMNTFFMTLLLGFAVGILGFFICPHLLSLYRVSETIRGFALTYMQAISLGLPIIMVATLLSSLIYTEGHAKISLSLSIFQLLLNGIMNYMLLGIFRLGLISVVIATLFSMLIQILLMVRFIQSEKMSIKFKFQKWGVCKAYFKEIIPLGMPTFITMILLSLTLGIESKIISAFGEDALSVQTITGYLFSFTGSVASGTMNAAVVLMSYSVGAKNGLQFKKIFKISLISVFIATLFLNLPLILNSRAVAQIFTLSASVAAQIKIPAYVYGLSAPFIFTTNVFLYAMIPIGLEKLSSAIFAIQQMILFVPLLFILKPFGFYFAISAQPLAEVIGGIATLCLIPHFNRKLASVFYLDASQNHTRRKNASSNAKR